jgi:hypothetical protein
MHTSSSIFNSFMRKRLDKNAFIAVACQGVGIVCHGTSGVESFVDFQEVPIPIPPRPTLRDLSNLYDAKFIFSSAPKIQQESMNNTLISKHHRDIVIIGDATVRDQATRIAGVLSATSFRDFIMARSTEVAKSCLKICDYRYLTPTLVLRSTFSGRA